MSYSKFKPPFYNNKGKEKQLLNGIFHQHDLVCGCEEPASHVTWLLFHHCRPANFTSTELKEIKECLGTSKDTTHGDAVDGLKEGELEELFAEDIPDDG